jgi:transglutaminase-like putative cysteine protease
VDRTLSFENSAFSSWAQLEERLNHQVPAGTGGGLGGTTGFATDVSLDSPLVRTKDIVFTFSKSGPYAGPLYFRGVNETQTSESEWRYSVLPAYHEAIAGGQSPNYMEAYRDLALTTLQVNMLLPPAQNADIVFYPGQIVSINRDTVAVEALYPKGAVIPLATIDRLNSVRPSRSTGGYRITVEYSTATDVQLRAASTEYPAWLLPYMLLPAEGSYRPPEVIAAIRKLALQVTAGATNPYDKATAIETYLRTHYTYTLSPPSTFGQDPVDFFLFDSKKGFCAFFASAMGDMLRSIGIPTRLVSGFGPGTFNVKRNLYEVRGEDAHTWVESYFPGYGWITFEPTPDGVYNPVLRGAQGETLCLRDANCNNPSPPPTTGPPPTHRPGVVDVPPGGSTGAGTGGFGIHIPDASTLTRIVGVLLAVLLLFVAAAARYLRPRTVASVWKRTLMLARLAGAERRSGETPLELSRRLQSTFPEASESVGALASGFAIAAYAPPDLAISARTSVMDAWASLRPLLLRRVFARLRPNSY